VVGSQARKAKEALSSKAATKKENKQNSRDTKLEKVKRRECKQIGSLSCLGDLRTVAVAAKDQRRWSVEWFSALFIDTKEAVERRIEAHQKPCYVC
jgi:hypothetical protein